MKSNGLSLAVFLAGATLLASGQSTPLNAATLNEANSGGRVLLAAYHQQGSSSGQSSAGQSAPSANSVSSAGTPAPPSPDASDNEGLQSRIDDALRNESTLGASHVVSNVTDTGIELTGTVGSAKDKQTAERIASSFNGNRKLTDNIAITGAGHSDLAPNHPAMNNSGVDNAPNPATSNPKK
jgi:type IV secretory pathway TrbL component